MQVVKRDNQLVAFNSRKIHDAIYKAFVSAGVPTKGTKEVQDSVMRSLKYSNVELISVDQIHNLVERMLMKHSPNAAKAYIAYRIERNRIRESRTSLMNTIEELMHEHSKENANIEHSPASIMYQIGSAASKEYALLRGMPRHFALAHLSGDFHIHDLDYYHFAFNCMTHDLQKMLTEGFKNGIGHIRSPKRVTSASALTAIILQGMQNNMFGGQAIDYLDKALGDFVYCHYLKLYNKNLNRTKGNAELSSFWALEDVEEDVAQAMEALVYNLNSMKSRAGNQVVFSSLNLGTDTTRWGRLIIKHLLLAYKKGLGNGENPIFPNICFRVKDGINAKEGDPNYDLFVLAMECAAIRMNPTFANMDSTFNAPFGDGAGYMGCRTRVLSNVNGKETISGRGNLFFTTINLPRLGILANGNIVTFFNLLGKEVNIVRRQLLERYNVIKKLRVRDVPFAINYYVGGENLKPDDTIESAIKNGSLAIGFIGLAETLVALIGKHHGESRVAQELGLRIIETIRKSCDKFTHKYHLNFSLIATPAEGLSGRFLRKDVERFGRIKGVTDREYYTNSFHVPVYYECSMFDKICVEAPYHDLTNGGHISYIELPAPPKDNIAGLERLIKFMFSKNMGYIGVNFPIDFCNNCNILGVFDNDCPECGSSSIRRVRRITGYLSNVEQFNSAKEAELEQRVTHGGKI